ncbi:bifunctional diaminohydroxyphosphoribosylaminopyrimidine deaminase/5-amino-6-(5-phosphoribosylamino)uracil reductase RibD [soil metagenome]
MIEDQQYLRRALELAELGRGKVSPNPMVGCVIVHDQKIIGEGWHMKFGGPHAEVNAINDVNDKNLISESTLYVTLEPCSHFGKTPPCADLLIEHKVKRVVICNIDINPLVAGKGIKKLKEAGILVDEGLLAEKGQDLNIRFFNSFINKRPYIILKWAETADGFIARENFDSKWISNDLSRKLVHKWRSEEDAILIGTNTALYDNPQLSVRSWSGKNPVRIVIDRNLRLPIDLHLFDQKIKTLIFNLKKNENRENLNWVKIKEEHFLSDLLKYLNDKNIQSVIIEGGSQVLQEFINQNLWDEARIFKSNISFNKGIKAPAIEGRLIQMEQIHNDHLFFYEPLN